VEFWVEQLCSSCGVKSEEQKSAFRAALSKHVLQRVEKMWFPSEPLRASAARTVSVDGLVDEVLVKSAVEAGVDVKLLPRLGKSVCWINPGRVSVKRFDRDNCITVLYPRDVAVRG